MYLDSKSAATERADEDDVVPDGEGEGVPEDVTVVTITRGRPHLLLRAMQSVARQTHPAARIRHLIIVDDCIRTWTALTELDSTAMCIYSRRSAGDVSGPVRLARLRNCAVALVSTPWLAWLDDDNELEPSHLSSLFERQRQTGADAVHSYRRLYHSSGQPYLSTLWPWARTEPEQRRRYLEYQRLGVVAPGSNVVRDGVRMRDGRRELALVDTNLWLLRTDLLRRAPIPDRFDASDWERNLAEDDKMLDALLDAGAVPECTEQATVRYYLGGYSNDFDGVCPGTQSWAKIA